jgi:hypothetical protein
LRLKKIVLDETQYETERTMAMKFMQMYCETNGLSHTTAQALRDNANAEVRTAVGRGEGRTMFLARQHGFSDGAQSYINSLYYNAFNEPDAPERLAQAILNFPERMKQS